jgi:hypothetical protein
MNTCTCVNEVCYSTILCTCLQVLFESLFCLTKLLNMMMVRNFEFMFGKTKNQSVFRIL